MASTSLDQFFEDHPSIKKFTPGTDDFNATKKGYVVLDYEPSVIARPQTAEDVAAIVSHCAANDVPFAVRTGGHDVLGRCSIRDGLQIDMRDINHVEILPGRELARVGGGVFNGRLLEVLNPEGLTCATGTVSHVGFVGWSTLGGYGPLSPRAGLGVDQIVGAKLVNAEGKIVEADERLLTAIRGAGGAFGIIVEATIKVYPEQEAQAGLIIYESTSLSQTVQAWFKNFNELLTQHSLPENLYIQIGIIVLPGMGNTFIACFFWTGPESEQSKDWVEKISSLAPVLNNSIATTTQAGFVAQLSAVVPDALYPGKTQSVSVAGLTMTQETIDVIARHAELKPTDIGLLGLHTAFGRATEPSLPSVFRNRSPHYMLEIVGLANTEDRAEAGREWAENFAADLRKVDAALESSYLSLAPPEDATPLKVFGEDKLKFLLELKHEVDPKNVFKNSVPKLEG